MYVSMHVDRTVCFVTEGPWAYALHLSKHNIYNMYINLYIHNSAYFCINIYLL